MRRRSSSWFDPAVVAAFERAARDPALWAALDDGAEALVLAEAGVDETSVVGDDYLNDVAAAFADVVDAKSPFTAGHSRRVADSADNIAAAVGLSDVHQNLRRLRFRQPI